MVRASNYNKALSNSTFHFLPDAVLENISSKLVHSDILSLISVDRTINERFKTNPNLKSRLESIKHFKKNISQALDKWSLLKDSKEKTKIRADIGSLLNDVRIGNQELDKEENCESILIKFQTLLVIARKQVESNQREAALTTLSEAIKEAQSVNDHFERILNLISVAKAQFFMGFNYESDETFISAIKQAKQIDNPLKDKALASLSRAIVRTDKHDWAVQIASLIEDSDEKDYLIEEIFSKQLKQGQSHKAAVTALSIPDPALRARLLAAISQIQASVGLVDESNENLKLAMEAANSITIIHEKSQGFASIGRVQMKLKKLTESEETLKKANELAFQVLDCSSCVKALINISREMTQVR